MPNLFIMEAVNIVAGDNTANDQHLTIQELKLPTLEDNFADHAAGGAPIAIEVDTHMQRLEATFNLAGWTPEVANLVGRWSADQQHFTALGAIRDRRMGTILQARAIMWGRLGRVNPTNFRKGDIFAHEYSIRAITHYELTVMGQELFWWDFFTNVRRIGGQDVNAELNAALEIG